MHRGPNGDARQSKGGLCGDVGTRTLLTARTLGPTSSRNGMEATGLGKG